MDKYSIRLIIIALTQIIRYQQEYISFKEDFQTDKTTIMTKIDYYFK